LTAAGRYHVAEDGLLAVVVHGGNESITAGVGVLPRRRPPPAGRGHGPAGEAASDLADILLRVAAVHTKGMELHYFAGVVLVQTRGPLLLRLWRSGWRHSLRLLKLLESLHPLGRQFRRLPLLLKQL